MLRGMVSQGLGHTSGPHSSFIPYHVDALTLQAVGDGWHDELALGRCVESTFRSLNNLLEHFHQSFFFYLLMQAQRFVSIGTYLPSAMLVAVNFTIMAIALWILSGRPPKRKEGSVTAQKAEEQKVEVVEKDGMVAVIPTKDLAIVERQLFLPIVLVVSAHFLGAIPLYIFNNTRQEVRLHSSSYDQWADKFLSDTIPNSALLCLSQRLPPHAPCDLDIRLHDPQLPPPHPPPVFLATPARHVPRHTRDP